MPIPEELALHLPAEPDVLATVRSALRRWLRSQGVGAEAMEALVLAAGEAAANAVEHAYGLRAEVFDVTARREDDEIVIGVRDRGRWREPRERGRGRGLAIMESTVDAVEHRRTEDGTEVVLRRRTGGGDG